MIDLLTLASPTVMRKFGGLRIPAQYPPELCLLFFFNGFAGWGISNKIPISRAAAMIDIPLEF